MLNRKMAINYLKHTIAIETRISHLILMIYGCLQVRSRHDRASPVEKPAS
jgi:hypothetical protein